MKRGVILRASRRMLLFLSGVARILLCVALIIVPVRWVLLSRGIDGGDVFVPTRLHVLLVLTPAISAIATLFGWRRLRMSDRAEVPHRRVKGHIRPLAALLGMRPLSAILTAPPLLKLVSGLLVKRATNPVRRSRGGVRAVVGFLQGVALVVSAAYGVVFLGAVWGLHPANSFLSSLLLIVYASLVVLFPSVSVGGGFCLLLLISFFLPMEDLIGIELLDLVWLFSCFFFLTPPNFCVLGVALVRRLMIRGQDVRERFFSRSLLAGLCVGGLLIVVAEAPRTVTRYVISEHRTAGAPLAITPLRYFADWETLISVAEGQDKAFFLVPHLSIFGKSSPQLAREAIARLTGEEPTLVTDPNLPTNGQQVRR